MQHIGSLLLAFATLTAAVPGLAPASVRSAKSSHVRRADTSSFQIYAYGTGIGGLALFTAGGKLFPRLPARREVFLQAHKVPVDTT